MRVALLLGLCSCDIAFGLKHQDPITADAADDVAVPVDLDLDGIPDDIDPCIAPASDAKSDIDGDTFKNGADKCPLLTNTATAVDSDNDGLLDVCDPNPLLPDIRRCTMAFTDSTITDSLWRPVPPGLDFSHRTGALHCNAGTSCISAVAEPVGAPGGLTIYVARFETAPNPVTGGIALWPRLGESNATTNIGCVLFSDMAGAYHLTILNAVPAVETPIAAPGSASILLRTSISSGTPATVTCNASTNKNGTYDQPDLSTTIQPGPGTLGISVTVWATDITGLEVIQH